MIANFCVRTEYMTFMESVKIMTPLLNSITRSDLSDIFFSKTLLNGRL